MPKKSSALLEKELKRRVQNILKGLKKIFPKAPKCALYYSNPWELMVAVQLSAQCTDKKVNEVTPRLFKKYPRLTDYIRAKPKDFEQDIYQTGFYRNKTKNILAAAKVIQGKYKGKVPRIMEEILTVPGVGRKSANVILGNAYGVVEGIAVDTHVRRLSRQFGLSRHNDPMKIEKDLMKIIPRHEWFPFTYRLIEYGRQYCPARHRTHDNCPLKKFHVSHY